MSSSPDPFASWDLPVFKGPRTAVHPAAAPDGGWILPSLAVPRPETATESGGELREAEDVREAYERGRDEGLREGAAEAKEELRSAVDALRQVTESLSASRRQHLRDLEENVRAIALAVAKKIVLREVAADPGVVRDLVRRALELVDPDGPVEIRLHPEDLDLLREELAAESEGSVQEIRWSADPSLERGSFFMEGSHRIVDGRVDEALRALYESLAYE